MMLAGRLIVAARSHSPDEVRPGVGKKSGRPAKIDRIISERNALSLVFGPNAGPWLNYAKEFKRRKLSVHRVADAFCQQQVAGRAIRKFGIESDFEQPQGGVMF